MQRRTMTFQEASKVLDLMKPKIKTTDGIDLANLGEKKVEEEIIKYQVEMARRDRMGPFLGQIIKNTNCLFEDAASTYGGTASVSCLAEVQSISG